LLQTTVGSLGLILTRQDVQGKEFIMKKKRYIGLSVLAMVLVLSVTVLVGCGGKSGSGTPKASAEPFTRGLPLSLQSNGNTYSIEGITIDEDEAGNTTVVCTGSGFDVLPFKNNAMVIPVYCSILEGSSETEFESVSMGNGGITYIFDKKLDPDTVVFYPEDARDTRTEVPR
jgi:hypothetical protein